MTPSDPPGPPNPGAAPAPGAAADDAPAAADTLLQSLRWLLRHHGCERSLDSLLCGLPVEGRLTPELALRLLHEAGFQAALVQRPLRQLHPLLLPALLLLRGGGACVVQRRVGEGDATRYEIVVADDADGLARTLPADELEAGYLGVTLLAAPRPADAPQPDAALRDPATHWFWGTVRRFAPYYRSALVAALLSNVLMLVTGIVMAVVYDKVIPHLAFVTLWALASGAFVALVFDLFARQLRTHLIDLAGRKTDLVIGSALFRHSLGVRMEHRPPSAGSYAHQLAQIEVVRDFFAGATLSALSDLPFIVIFLAMTFVIGGPLGWVLAIAIPVILAIAAVIQGALRRSLSANLAQQADLHGVLVESIEGMEDLKAAGAQGRFVRRYEQSTAVAADTALRARTLSGWATNLSTAAQQAVTLVMLVWGVYLIGDGAITGGALIGAVMFAGRAVAPLNSLVMLATRYQSARAAMQALDELMKLPTDREPGRRYVVPPQVQGALALRDLGFAYPGAGDDASPRVLKGLNLRIEPGERVAILGRIGSGKSTVLRLLGGLYLPSEGMVEVDGIDLRQIDPADFRRSVGFVSQEPRLFNGTLRDNVLLGRAAIDGARLVEIARMTGLDRIVAAHPKGWDLSVGEMGNLLSGGQRQMVALARCLATQPPILLMDEPTSSMDAQSETQFLRQLKAAIAGRTVVVVTHRPAVLDLVDRVVVLDAGRIVMDGSKAQVLAALSGQRPGPAPAAAATLHLHPSAQPVARDASI